MKTLAGSLLNQFGQTITLRRISTGTFDPFSGITTASATTDYPCKAVVSPYNSRHIDGNLIKAGDLQVTISASSLSTTPDQSTDNLIVGGQTFKIVQFERISPDGTDITFVVQARSGS